MSNQAPSGRLYSNRNTTVRQPRKGLVYLLLAAICLLVATSAYWLSKKNSAERSQEAPLTSTRLPPSVTSANEASGDTSPIPEEGEASAPLLQGSTSTKQVTAAYSVLPARAYFHSEPTEKSSTGKYVLRGDIVYAEGESGNFIKTRYFNAKGDPVTGWLKKTEVRARKSSAQPTPPRAPTTSPRRAEEEPAAPPTQTKKPAAATSEPKETIAAVSRPPATTGTVRVDTTYFYDSPDLTQRRRAFCIRGDKMTLTDSSEQAVFVTFVNWEKVKTTGWIRKQDLTIR